MWYQYYHPLDHELLFTILFLQVLKIYKFKKSTNLFVYIFKAKNINSLLCCQQETPNWFECESASN